MRTLKIFKGAMVTLMLTLLVGCSDNFVSPISAEKNSGVDNSRAELKKVPANEYQTIMELKPGQSITFSRGNTGISAFHVISIKDANKKGFEVIGYVGDIAFLLQAESKGFTATSISIENQSQYVQELDIYLAGDVEIINPIIKHIKSE